LYDLGDVALDLTSSEEGDLADLSFNTSTIIAAPKHSRTSPSAPCRRQRRTLLALSTTMADDLNLQNERELDRLGLGLGDNKSTTTSIQGGATILQGPSC
jgi:hypothetical protein